MLPGGVTFTYDQSLGYASGTATTTDGVNFSGTITSTDGFGVGDPISWLVSGTTVTGGVIDSGLCGGGGMTFTLYSQ
jgi:hypothetical protein